MTESPPRSRLRSVGLLGAAVAVVVPLLMACDKPQPTVTVFTGTKAKQVSAQPVCTIVGRCQTDLGKIARITAASGSDILIDVPKNLAQAGWLVAAFTTDAAGKNTPLSTPGAGTSTMHGNLSTKVSVPAQSAGSYFLQVSSLKPSSQLTTWLVGVDLTN
ncbi:MAG: hypothetical protein JWN95_2763 [Frankiales bacterium]|nr:hypothetical protein [Frankiales bacterium]